MSNRFYLAALSLLLFYTDIVKAFEKSLELVEWMDEESAEKAREKAEAIRKKVGFPLSPDTRDPRSLVSYYTLVKVHVDTFFENMLSAASVSLSIDKWQIYLTLYPRASDVYKMWQKLGKSRNLDEWEMTPATVNAYYNPTGNEVRRSQSTKYILGFGFAGKDRVPRRYSPTTFLFP